MSCTGEEGCHQSFAGWCWDKKGSFPPSAREGSHAQRENGPLGVAAVKRRWLQDAGHRHPKQTPRVDTAATEPACGPREPLPHLPRWPLAARPSLRSQLGRLTFAFFRDFDGRRVPWKYRSQRRALRHPVRPHEGPFGTHPPPSTRCKGGLQRRQATGEGPILSAR